MYDFFGPMMAGRPYGQPAGEPKALAPGEVPPPPRLPPSRPIRAVLLTPGMGMGGAERVFISLVKHFVGVEPLAIVTRLNFSDEGLAAEARRYCPVEINPDNSRVWTAAKLREHCARAHVLISWGVSDLPFLRHEAGIEIPVLDLSQNSWEWPELVAMSRQAEPGADYLAGVSEAAVKGYTPQRQAEAVVLWNGIELDRVTPRHGRDATRKAWGLYAGERVLLFLARFAAVKNPAAILAALDHLPTPWRAVCVGPDSLDKCEFAALAAERHPRRVAFAPPVTQIGDYLAAADVYCLPSHHEGLPLALLEAMAAGVPCVTCRWDSMHDLVRRHGELCCTVPVKPSGLDLATAVMKADRIGRDNALTQHARHVVWEHYTASGMAARWEAHLAYVLADWHRRASLSRLIPL